MAIVRTFWRKRAAFFCFFGHLYPLFVSVTNPIGLVRHEENCGKSRGLHSFECLFQEIGWEAACPIASRFCCILSRFFRILCWFCLIFPISVPFRPVRENRASSLKRRRGGFVRKIRKLFRLARFRGLVGFGSFGLDVGGLWGGELFIAQPLRISLSKTGVGVPIVRRGELELRALARSRLIGAVDFCCPGCATRLGGASQNRIVKERSLHKICTCEARPRDSRRRIFCIFRGSDGAEIGFESEGSGVWPRACYTAFALSTAVLAWFFVTWHIAGATLTY